MKLMIHILALMLLPALAQAEKSENKVTEYNKVNRMADKKFDLQSLNAGGLGDKKSDMMKKTFPIKENSIFSKKTPPGLDRMVPTNTLNLNKEFPTNQMSLFEQENTMFKAQSRFDVSKSATIKTKQAKETDLVSSFDGKQYEGKELEAIQRHVQQIQEQLTNSYAPDDSDLSVEKIREILNQK